MPGKENSAELESNWIGFEERVGKSRRAVDEVGLSLDAVILDQILTSRNAAAAVARNHTRIRTARGR